MKKVLLFASMLLASVVGAKAQHNFSPVSFIKTPGLATATMNFSVNRWGDSLWFRVRFCSDSNFTGTIAYGPMDSAIFPSGSAGMVSGVIPITDTTICYLQMVSGHRDTVTHAIMWDTSCEVVMSKLPTIVADVSATTDSISYNLYVNGGNNNGVPVLAECFIDSTLMYSIYSRTFTVSGSTTATFNGSVGGLTTSAPYYLRFTVTNPITGVASVKQMQMTTSSISVPPYLEADSAVMTPRSISVNVSANVFGHPASVTFLLRKLTEATWSKTRTIVFDSTVTGLQTQTVMVDSLIPSTDYVYDVKAVNVVGTTYLGTHHAKTTDTLTTFGLTPVFATVDRPMHVKYELYYSNVGNNTANITMAILKDGIVLNTVALDGLGGNNLVDTAFTVIDTGWYDLISWGFDNSGTFIATDTLHVYVGPNHTAVMDLIEKSNPFGTANIFSLNGKFLVTKDILFDDRARINFGKEIPTGIYVLKFISNDGKFWHAEQIFVR